MSYGLTSQLRRASVSIPANIAEGCGRLTTQQYIHFLGVSKGSLWEMETLLVIASKMGYLQIPTIENLMEKIIELNKMIKSLIQVLELKKLQQSR